MFATLGLGKRHLVNAYEVKAGIGVQVTPCDLGQSALEVSRLGGGAI